MPDSSTPPPARQPASQPARPPAAPDGNALLRLIFDHAREGISVFDASLRLQAWNAQFIELVGLPLALVQRGAPLQRLALALAEAGEFGPGDAAAAAARRVDELSLGPPSVTERVRPDGRTIELRRSPTPGGGFVMFYADITERKAAQARQADQQRMLALLIAHTEQGIWFIDNEVRTTDANPAMCRMLGLALPQLQGRSIFDFVDADNERIFRAQVQHRSQGQAEGYEITLRRADGSPVHCFNNATPIFDAAGRKVGAVGMFSDISPLKHAEQQLRLAGELLEHKSHLLEVTLDSLSQGVLSIDAQGRTSTFNRRFLELLQIPLALMQTRPTMEALGRHQIEHGLLDRGGFTPRLHSWRSDPPRYQRRRRDGMLLEVQTHPAGDGSVVRTYTDVTASEGAQQALSESEARFRTMADAAPAFIWLAAADSTPLWFNQRWLAATGRTRDAELALPWARRLHADDLQRCLAVFGEAAARQAPYEAEFRLPCADGSVAWIADHGVPRLGADGRFEGYTVYGWDITARKAAEAALIAARDEAERANRAKSEFLSRMSHELRTPLNAVLGFAQLMQSDAADPLSASQLVRVQELLRGGRHLLSLINDVLDIARIEAGTLQLHLAAVNLPTVVAECLPLVRSAAAERGITLDVQDGGSEADHVLADPIRLKQVLLNLLSNAVKYNRLGGQVQIAWRREPGDRVRIEVRDSGPGLGAAEQDRLFQAFERLDAANSDIEGAGIGLALSRWLVDLMQGRIGVQSAPGEGSVFWVSLAHSPAAVAVAVPDRAAPLALLAPLAPLAPPAAQPSAQRQHTVLYIEDNEVNQILMAGMLAHRPAIRLLMTDLPQVGLALAAQQKPDLVLLDIQLPGMDGYEVLSHLRRHAATRSTPVVAVSANAMPADHDKAQRAGFEDYITKPLDLQALLLVVDRLLAG